MARADFSIEVGKKGEEELTKTEWKVIEQVEYGLSNKEIADILNLSEGTVRNYLSAILNKLRLRDRTQLAIWAIQSGVGKVTLEHHHE
jgi:DNA-binding NarL/FixJ family response regulator